MSPSSVVANDELLIRDKTSLWRAGEFGVVVLVAGSVSPTILEGTGADLWEILESPCSRQELAAALAARFGADASVVARDLTPVIEELLRLGILETSQ